MIFLSFCRSLGRLSFWLVDLLAFWCFDCSIFYVRKQQCSTRPGLGLGQRSPSSERVLGRAVRVRVSGNVWCARRSSCGCFRTCQYWKTEKQPSFEMVTQNSHAVRDREAATWTGLSTNPFFHVYTMASVTAGLRSEFASSGHQTVGPQ